ncbi:hypothetical protein COCC4DRAFT_30331 [Bipolaris maydis ATCC 48331]|uniref:Zn(2)-C6 fungal-type domain-containing protein n=2 Tax=Cochliobolus heterostrophus TaxID=5016 RepID=M2TZP4_COCH5|nr:uncharacterized protein COCC4DRAFT_30331 [Bipolaris maydis ATCC 48331]EMD91749.1 hypothetical protein COCHEDRAFT_1021608 [Bipolaris maydis C5]KAJ5027113.1 hypothetical protein J3E73DRAFT_301480 [Bipolaris maydis]ENI08492.1 hypothetical protein COCC4DRAFT_30331 [Bipolaris maydis ATCC 48331]KAJ5059122.1 hypothetical protein J3E74DRAFT_355573 [Bipolaris maydis]KAJ6202706.1 hypothetical protein J3E72DRAFT_277937 [Bipolaris maydis]
MPPGQGSVRAAEKLHAACDECRTRKLRCSGDTPKCLRCTREQIGCVYSPQKQMGRPRKRRREGEAGESATFVQGRDENTAVLNSFSEMQNCSDFDGLISPPLLQDTYSSNESSGHEALTPGQFDFTFPEQLGILPGPNFTSYLEPAIDPSLWELQPDTLTNNINDPLSDQQIARPCTCITTTWMVLTELQAITTFDFPQVVIPLRNAMSALANIINCPQCPKDSFSAIQNVQSIVSLMKAIVQRFNSVLLEVDREAVRLEEAGQKKAYRIGDNNPALSHLHTGTSDCPMGFNIELEPKDWRRLVKTALKTEVYGKGSNPRPLLDLVKKSEMRQEEWHNDRHSWVDEMIQLHGGRKECHVSEGCEALGAQHIRRAIDNLKWD